MNKVRMRPDLAEKNYAIAGRLIEGDGVTQDVLIEKHEFEAVDGYLADDLGNVVISMNGGAWLFIVDSIDLEFYTEGE